ncbi:MAG: hypothetical protein HQK49_05555 [Oligoflexia bacterium]|nr:hypothetical protein [Oligoflexia bacterium]
MHTNDSFINFIIDHKVLTVSSTPFTLASGQKSHLYINWRSVTNNFFLFDKLLKMVLEFIQLNNIHCDTFYGVPEGASKLALFVQYFYLQKKYSSEESSSLATLAMGRGVPKNHGSIADKYFIGQPIGDVIIIEDVTTTGESLIKTIEIVKELPNTKVIGCLVLTDRSHHGSKSMDDYFVKNNIKLYSLSNMDKIIQKINSNFPKLAEEINLYEQQ